jgi:hypothetical protein
MERTDTRTVEVEDENRERLISFWEQRLSDSLHAVRVAQQTLEGLYKQRYVEVEKPLESTGYQRRLDQEMGKLAVQSEIGLAESA